MERYDGQFFTNIGGGSRRSAEAVVPIVVDLVHPKTVVDVGCGSGTWLSVFRAIGIEDVLGVDGDWVDENLLRIPRECFLRADLEKPLALDKRFDLVASLEVAEHLPPRCADTFVDSLCRLGQVILFSAAIPFQGGRNHVNEQWPEYWAQRFRRKGFAVADVIRRRIWTNPNVDWWYAQNTLLYVREDQLSRYPALAQAVEAGPPPQLSIVHPRNYSRGARRDRPSLRDVLTLTRRFLRGAIKPKE